MAAVLAAGIGLHFLDSAWVVRVSNAAIGVQVAAALVAFTLPKTMPTERKYEGETCPDLDSGQGYVMTAIAFGSIVTGAVALAASFIAVRRRVAQAESPPRRDSRRRAHAGDPPAAGRRRAVRLLRLTGGELRRQGPRACIRPPPMSSRRPASLCSGRDPACNHLTLPGGSMRFLLTSAGIKNASIHDALVGLLGKPIAECSALVVPTAAYGHPLTAGRGVAVHQRTGSQNPHVRIGLEVSGRAGAHRTAEHPRRAVGHPGPGD